MAGSSGDLPGGAGMYVGGAAAGGAKSGGAGAASVGGASHGGTAGESGAVDDSGAAGVRLGAGGSAAAGSGPIKSPFQCDSGVSHSQVGVPLSSCAATANDPCQLCVQAHCCSEYEDCFAQNPGNQCGYGGPNDAGEIGCIQRCIQDELSNNGIIDTQAYAQCANVCASTLVNRASLDCGGVIGTQTGALLGCLKDECPAECLGG
jgi:hypothetical protein